MKKSVYFLIIFFFIVQNIFGQYVYKGRVLEKDGIEPIPFVNITALPSSEGTTTDIDGKFVFKSDKKPLSLTFSFIGYETLKYKVEKNKEDSINIKLIASDIRIDETVIIAKRRNIQKDTAAITLYRNVVKHKDENQPKGLDSYYYKEHTKMEFDLYKFKPKFPTRWYMKPFKIAFDYTDTTEAGHLLMPALLQEDLVEIYYNKDPLKNKKIILASQATGLENMSANLLVSNYLQRIDMYDNVIEAGGKSFSSPFSPSGIVTYAYFLSDSTVNSEGVTLYRLDFSPRNNYEIAFNGYAWIEAENFAITQMEFRVPSKANINFINDFYVNQSFEKPDGKNWFLTAEEMHVSFNLTKSKKTQSVLLQKRIKRDDIDLNNEYNPENFKGEALIIEDSVNNRSEEWWEENRISPLTETEKNIFVVVDSVTNMLIYRDMQRLIYFATTGYARFGKKVPVEIGQIHKFFSWNNVEGIRLKFGARTNKFLSKDFQLEAYAAYGLKDKQWKGLVNLHIMLPQTNHHWHTLNISYTNDFTFLGATNTEQKFNHDNIFLSLLRSAPLEKIMRIEDYAFEYEREWLNGFSTILKGSRKTFFAIPNTFEFNTYDQSGALVSLEKFSTTEIGLETLIEFGKNYFRNDYFRLPAGSKQPEIRIGYTLGLKGALGGEYNYHKFSFNLYHRLTNKIGFTKYQVKAGYILGDAPYPLMFMHQGNNNFYYSGSAYSNMGEFEYASDRYAALWLDHHFDGKILNAIPLIKRLQFRSIFLFKILVGDIKGSNRSIIEMPNSLQSTFNEKEKIYAEMGFGIENILKVLRVDFMWRLTQRDKVFDGKNIQKFAIKFAFQPKF